MAKTYTTEGGVFRLLEKRYTPDKYALFSQVANSTGFGKKRSADAIAFGLWPSRGLEIEGFEIKVSRSDWLSELKDHAKSADIQAYCHRWWIVAGDRNIVKPEELPSTWGLIVPRGQDGLESKVKAPKLTPKKLSRKFCAAVMRRAAEGHTKEKTAVYNQLYEKAYAAAEKTSMVRAKRELDRENSGAARQLEGLQRKCDSLKLQLDRYQNLEAAAGINMRKWDFDRILVELAMRDAEYQAKDIEARISNFLGSVDRIEDAPARARAVAELLKSELFSSSQDD